MVVRRHVKCVAVRAKRRQLGQKLSQVDVDFEWRHLSQDAAQRFEQRSPPVQRPQTKQLLKLNAAHMVRAEASASSLENQFAATGEHLA